MDFSDNVFAVPKEKKYLQVSYENFAAFLGKQRFESFLLPLNITEDCTLFIFEHHVGCDTDNNGYFVPSYSQKCLVDYLKHHDIKISDEFLWINNCESIPEGYDGTLFYSEE